MIILQDMIAEILMFYFLWSLTKIKKGTPKMMVHKVQNYGTQASTEA